MLLVFNSNKGFGSAFESWSGASGSFIGDLLLLLLLWLLCWECDVCVCDIGKQVQRSSRWLVCVLVNGYILLSNVD